MIQDTFRGLPMALVEWGPIAQATTLGVATLVQEDVPTVTAAVFASVGKLAWQVGFLGCFLGIWIGDLLLYLLARSCGPALLKFAWAKRLASPESVARSERWFADKGTWLLVSSRFVPGTRLPTYLAAGFLRLPFLKFGLVTATMVAIWTVAIFGLARVFGDRLSAFLHQWEQAGWMLLGVVALAFVVVRFLPRLLNPSTWRRVQAACERWRRWEFWPAWLFYFPVGLNYLRLAWKYRSLTLPSAANPGIVTGGLVGESKYATLSELYLSSPEFTAESWLIDGTDPVRREANLIKLMEQHRLAYPFILKPDLGQRGIGVKLIRNAAEAMSYVSATDRALVAQRYVPGPLEAGLFYYRFPTETRGRLFAITEKIFPEILGDGVHTVEQLIWKDARARCVAGRYLARFAHRRDEVLPAGQRLRLVEAGNHAQGCIFRDGARWWSPELETRIDEISQRLPGFFIGRFDVRFESEEELRAGRGFQILELNGASAEATHIYDDRRSLRSAYATLFQQWGLVFAIGAANRTKGTKPMPSLELWRIWSTTRQSLALAPGAD